MCELYSVGELLIDFQSVGHGSLKETSQFIKNAGGAPANVCVQAVKLGHKAHYLTKVGNDGFGDFLVQTLKDEGVDISFVSKSDEYNTSLAFVSICENGERDFSFYRTMTADLYFTEEDFKDVKFSAGDYFEFGSVALATDVARNTHKYLLERAKKAGSVICFDPNLRFNLWKDKQELKDVVMQFAAYADVVKVGKDELEFLTGRPDGEGDLFALGVKVVAITDGSKGATVSLSDGRKYECGGYKVKAVDATGAGDSFFGAFISGLMDEGATRDSLLAQGTDYGAILDFACKCGAYTATRYGAIPAMGNRENVNEAVK